MIQIAKPIRGWCWKYDIVDMKASAMVMIGLLVNNALSISFFKKQSSSATSPLRDTETDCFRWVPHVRKRALGWFRDNKHVAATSRHLKDVNELIANDPYIAVTFLIM